MVGAYGLLAGGDEILLSGTVRIVGFAADLVKLLVEVVELGYAGHDVLVHEVRRLEDVVASGGQEGYAEVYESLVQKHSAILEEVAPVPRHVGAPHGLVAVDPPEQVVVSERLLGRALVRKILSGNGQAD